MNTVTLIVAAIITIFLLISYRREGFETIAEKDKAHKDYFSGTQSPTYEDYRERVAGGNVVDYMKYKTAQEI